MSYVLAAILASSVTLERASLRMDGSYVVPLGQGISMIPVTAALFDHLTTQPVLPLDDAFDLFYFLPPALVSLCVPLSEQGAVAYVEAEFFGGTGEQHCVVWNNGSVILGPLDKPDAINQALRQLGVSRTGSVDEFDAIGLGRHRSPEEWIEEDSHE